MEARGGPDKAPSREKLPAIAGTCYRPIPLPGTTQEMDDMNAHMEMDNTEVLRVKLEVLRQEHRDLDEAIHVMETSGRADQLRLKRLKKQKLMLKDQIARIEDILTPDIIA